jgi:hypothetical protein
MLRKGVVKVAKCRSSFLLRTPLSLEFRLASGVFEWLRKCCAASALRGATCRQSWRTSFDRGPDRQLTLRLAS